MLSDSTREFGKYFLVQLVAYAIEWGVYLLGRHAGIDVLPCNVLAKIAALSFAFFSHRAFTFRSHSGSMLAQGARYLAGFAFNTSASTYLLWLLMHAHLTEWLAKFLSDTLIVGLSFVIAKTLIFQSTGPRNEKQE